MNDFQRSFVSIALCALVCALVFGCRTIVQEDDSGIRNVIASHLTHKLKQYDLPAICEEQPAVLPSLGATREFKAPDETQRHSMSLIEAIREGLKNSRIIRQNAQFFAVNNSLLDSPDNTPSIYDMEILDNGILFGSRGMHAAMSDFDPKFFSSIQYGNDAIVPNDQYLGGGLPPGTTVFNATVQTQARLDQTMASGGTVSVVQNWTYDDSNFISRLFPSAFTGDLGLEYRQPLLAGAGEEYTSVAGPITQRARGFSPINQGVVIALINKQISQLDFEGHVHNFVKEIGDLYWDLYFAYREYEAETHVRDLAQQAWDETNARMEEGLEGGSALEEAQAADIYFDAVLRTESALANIYTTETRFRRLIGWSGEEDRLIYPSDDPIAVDLNQDRLEYLQDAFTNRVELKRQKMNIESIRMQWRASKSLLYPRLDFVGGYKLNGFGRNLIAGNTDDGITRDGYNSAYAALFRGNQSTWDIGLELNVPVYYRAELAQMHQQQLRMAKASAALADQEAEIAHELTFAFQTMQRSLKAIELNRRRQSAAVRRTAAAVAEYKADRTRLEALFRAQMNESQANSAYQRSLTEYNKSLLELQFRSGILLGNFAIQMDSALPPEELPPSPE